MLKRLSLLLTLACLLGACRFGAAVEVPAAAASGASAPAHAYAGTVERGKAITSKITGIIYPYHVYLPEHYATSGKRYDVMYTTDGQWTFPAFSRMLDQRRKPMILISIEQGGEDRRATDYTAKGAPAYARFLKEELAPLIERSYRTTDVRSYAGTSLGGLLGALMLSTEDATTPLFRNYLLFDGSFFMLTDSNLKDEDARFAASHRLPVRLFVTGAMRQGNERDVATLAARYQARPYVGLQVHHKNFDVTHFGIADPSFDWAIDLID
ncbi:alpha/beta hydrolase [Roseateles sp. P5_E7]